MQAQFINLCFCGALLLVCGSVRAQESDPPAYPAEFSLIQDSEGQWTYVKFPEDLALYVYDADSEGKSNCNASCAEAWPPVIASDDAEPIGHWTLIVRDDGSKQWAYKGRPVYLYFHDIPSDPQGLKEGWSLIQY